MGPMRVVAVAAVALLVLVTGQPSAHADPIADAMAAIDTYALTPANQEVLGPPMDGVRAIRGGAEQPFANGTVYFSPATGAHAVLGAIADRYTRVGGPATIGFPVTDEQTVGDGRFSRFSWPGGAEIYWSPQTRASLVTGGVLRGWLGSGGATGPFGFPITDTAFTGMDDESTFAGPEGTKISWSSTRGLTTVPAGLAASLPAMAEAAQSTALPSVSTEASQPVAAEKEGFGRWWPWLLAAVILVLLLGLLSALARRRRPAADATHVARRTPPAPAPVATGLVAAEAPVEAEVPIAAEVQVEADAEPVEEAAAPVYLALSDETVAASTAVLSYESSDTAGIVVHYENNAIGDDHGAADDETIATLLQGIGPADEVEVATDSDAEADNEAEAEADADESVTDESVTDETVTDEVDDRK